MSKLILFALIMFAGWLLLRRTQPKQLIDQAEARAILGVDATADADAVRAAHRRLLNAVHPDKGGSADLTRRINAARDVLLKR
ncbi:J domain-containing protein [Sphingomonas endolithica]|jgi:DnaJ family protein C protein 19|uniref:J domain-containing protein n=1 Tax=Sphingomonas endolithica TaxID=2972485 RepID=UPI0021B02724|nr:DnaJ domain-containing protein [Sphingomonas sp. ZFBP2030]